MRVSSVPEPASADRQKKKRVVTRQLSESDAREVRSSAADRPAPDGDTAAAEVSQSLSALDGGFCTLPHRHRFLLCVCVVLWLPSLCQLWMVGFALYPTVTDSCGVFVLCCVVLCCVVLCCVVLCVCVVL